MKIKLRTREGIKEIDLDCTDISDKLAALLIEVDDQVERELGSEAKSFVYTGIENALNKAALLSAIVN